MTTEAGKPGRRPITIDELELIHYATKAIQRRRAAVLLIYDSENDTFEAFATTARSAQMLRLFLARHQEAFVDGKEWPVVGPGDWQAT